MKRLTIRITEVQFNHFASFAEREGCKSVSDMFRKAGFLRWPMTKSAVTKASTGAILTTQEEKKEEREKSPHTPLKEKEARKEEPLHSRAQARDGRFSRPTVEEIADYCRSRSNGLDAEQIWDFYESKGWFIGKSKMKNWRSAVRTWEMAIEPYRKYQRELRFKAALYRLRKHPELQATLRAIRLHKKKEKIISALKIRAGTYRERFSQLTQILKSRLDI